MAFLESFRKLWGSFVSVKRNGRILWNLWKNRSVKSKSFEIPFKIKDSILCYAETSYAIRNSLQVRHRVKRTISALNPFPNCPISNFEHNELNQQNSNTKENLVRISLWISAETSRKISIPVKRDTSKHALLDHIIKQKHHPEWVYNIIVTRKDHYCINTRPLHGDEWSVLFSLEKNGNKNEIGFHSNEILSPKLYVKRNA